MGGEISDQAADAHYNEFYRDGGWKHSYRREYAWHKRNVARRFRLKRGMRMLEVACGAGFHTHVFNRMGFDCVGVDRSQSGIEWACEHHPKWTYHCCDFRAMPFPPASFDIVFARGFSYYHYDLAGPESHEATDTLMAHLKPGGLFVMIIATDLSGRREPGKIWQNTLNDYHDHFSSFGRRWSVAAVDGIAICGLWNEPLAVAESSERVTAAQTI